VVAQKKHQTISFHRMFPLVEKKRGVFPTAPDWHADFERLRVDAGSPLTVDSMLYDPHLTPGGRPVLGIHKPFDPAFMSQMDQHRKLADLVDEDDAHKWFTSTAVAFLPGKAIFALARGAGRSGPGPSDVVAFLDKYLPLDRPARWGQDPAMDEAKIAEFKKDARGVTKFAGTFGTAKDLFTPDDEGILGYADHVAEHVNGELIVELKIRLADPSQRGPAKRLRAMVERSLPRIGGHQATKAKVTAILDDGAATELNLVAQRFSVTEDIDVSAPEDRRFSVLIDHVADVGARYEDRFDS
jgi:hypothetical protein